MMAFGSGATFLGADAGVPRTLRAARLWAAHGAMHAVRGAVHGLPRTVHARTAMLHPLRTVLRAAVHGVRSAMLRAVTGAAEGNEFFVLFHARGGAAAHAAAFATIPA